MPKKLPQSVLDNDPLIICWGHDSFNNEPTYLPSGRLNPIPPLILQAMAGEITNTEFQRQVDHLMATDPEFRARADQARHIPHYGDR